MNKNMEQQAKRDEILNHQFVGVQLQMTICYLSATLSFSFILSFATLQQEYALTSP